MAIIKKFNNEDKVVANKSIIDHSQLSGTKALNCHPISAIRKLPEKLTALKEKDAELSQAIIDEETRATNREDAIEDNAQRISLVDNNNGTLTFTNYDNVNNTVKSGHLVDDITIKEINDHSTLEVIGIKGTFEKDNQSITKVYDAEDIYDDIKSSEQISLTAQLDNGNNPTGKLLFKDYSGVVSEVQGGFLPDDDTVQLSNNKLAIKKVYVDSDTIVGDGASIDSKLNAKAIKDANGTITVSQINTMSSEIQSIQGRGGYLRPYDFQTTNPDLPKDNLTAQPPVHSLLTQYALQEISNITDPIEIFNGTRVTNLFNNHTWILNNTQDTNPIVFEWVDLGQSLVSVATNDTLGVVKGSDQDLEGSIDVNGVITINGLSQELSDLHTNKQNVMQVSTMPNAGVDYLNKVFQFIGTTGTYTNSYFYKCILDSNDNLYKWVRVDVQPATPLVWGNITGTLSNQTDLQNALNDKQPLIDSSNKLDADLVDDSTSTNKFVTSSDISTWNGKQDALVSGTNIKTINNGSLLGSGNINVVNDITLNGTSIVSGNDAIIPTTQVAAIPIDSSVTSGSSNPISGGAVYTALRGKEDISNKVTSLSSQSTDTEYPSAKVVYDNLQAKQDSLVSGSSIKTLNSQSLLGSGNIAITSETSTINVGDKVENIYVNNHIDKSVVDTLLSNLPYTEDVDLPDGQGGVITITSCGRYLIEGTVKINADTYAMDPVIYAADCAVLGNYFSISGCTGHAIVAGYGNKLIYLEYDTPENRQLCDQFGFTINGAGFTDVESFNIFELLAETYGETPDYSSNYDNGLTVTSVYSSAKSFTDLLVAKYPNTYSKLVTKENLKEELTTKQDKVNIIKSTDSSATITLQKNTSYRYIDSNGLSTLNLTVSSPDDDFACEVIFISGSTATIFTSTGINNISGDDVSYGVFTPVPNETYNMVIWYDSINVNAIVRGV